jgi:hypothetical protein
MKVIGAGFGRTGATSLKVALEELRFDPRYHVRGPFDNPEHVHQKRSEPPTWQLTVVDPSPLKTVSPKLAGLLRGELVVASGLIRARAEPR